MVKNPPAYVGDPGSIPGSERSPGERNGNPLQYSCLWNPTESGDSWATVHRVAKGQTQLNNQTTTTKEHIKVTFWRYWQSTRGRVGMNVKVTEG